MLYRAERFFLQSPPLPHTQTQTKNGRTEVNTHTNVNSKQTNIWQCWQTSKSTVERFHSTPSEPKIVRATEPNSKEQRKPEPIGYWVMIVYLFIELLETSGKMLKNWVKNIVKTTSVINKKNATRLLKADLVFNDTKKNTNTQNDGTIQQQMTTFFPPKRVNGNIPPRGNFKRKQRTDRHIKACSASVSTHSWQLVKRTHTHTRLAARNHHVPL